MTRFTLGQYRDTDSGRYRWAALGPSGVWYFPRRYGRAAAVALVNRLNQEVPR